MKRLLVALAALQLGDVVTTWLSLHRHGIEANQFVAANYLAYGLLGWTSWVGLKLVLVAAIGCLALEWPRLGREVALVAIGICLAINALNLMVLA